MSAAFTTITDGFDWQDVAFVNELARGVRERQIAADAGGLVALVSAGDDIQAASFWSALQSAVDAVLTSYLSESDYGTTNRAAFTFYDSATFRSQAGLHADGWRRATAWPTDWTDLDDAAYSYGTMQAGDIIGPWVFDDLQNALAVLRKTKFDASDSADLQQRFDDTTGDTGWTAGGSVYHRRYTYEYLSQPAAYGVRSKVVVPSKPNTNDCDIDCWLYFEIPSVGYTFADLAVLGATEYEWCRVATEAANSATSYTSTLIDGTFPAKSSTFEGQAASVGCIVCAWDFTNA